MEIIIAAAVGLAFGITSVFFYVLGLSHGRKVEKGLQVKLEPVKAVVNAVESVKTEQKDKAETKKQQEQVMQILNYNGERREVNE